MSDGEEGLRERERERVALTELGRTRKYWIAESRVCP